MTQELKDEALEQIISDIEFGFENEEELFDSICDMFYDEESLDKVWLRKTITENYLAHQKQSLQWARPTDFDRLVNSFDTLIREKIVCLHNAGYTRQDAESDCLETIEALKQSGVNPIGFCYYHSQDLARAIDPTSRTLLLGFDSADQNESNALQIANRIIATLNKNGFEVAWPGTVDQRIEIKNIRWQKVPDNQDWSMQRVLEILSKEKSNKKPFWKFW